ncbi:MAG: TIGR01777 family oxidoreductase [Blastocatellia bacterium]
MKLLITGATGLVGRALCRSLKNDGHSVAALSRTPDPARVPQADAVFAWQPEAGMPPAAAFEGVDGVIHLAGESVAARRWNDEHKRRVRDSRVLGTRHLVAAMQALAAPPRVFISASAVGFYGDRGDETLDEHSPPGRGFLSEVCMEWEGEAQRAAEFGARVVLLRIGVVLSRQDGALAQMLPIFKLGLAGKLGSGRQWFPWIHLDDVVGIIRFALEHPGSGPVNAAAPGIVTNAEFTDALAQALHRPAFFAAPAFGLKLVMGEMAAVVLASQRAVPQAALNAGYRFRYPELRPALAELFA